MDILVITPAWNPQGKGAGLTFSIKPVVDRLVELGHNLTILTLESHKIKNVKDSGKIEVIRISDNSTRYLQDFSVKLMHYLIKNKPFINKFDIIHLHAYSSLFALSAIIALHFLKIKTRILFTPHYHGITDSKIKDICLKIYDLLGKFIFDKSDRIICVSEYEASILKKQFKINNNKISVIAHGVSVTPGNGKLKRPSNNSKHGKKEGMTELKIRKEANFFVSKPIVRQPLKPQRGSNQVNLLYVGRLVKHKGVHYILKSMSILKDKYNLKPILDIVGSGGPFEKNLKIMAKSLELEENINWDGYLSQEELILKYQNSDMFLLLSWAEAYGLVVADALVLGVPCIVANTSALSEFIKEQGCFGIEFPPNPIKLASLIFKIHNNDVKIGPFSERKIRTWDRVADEYEELYKRLI